MNLKVLYNFHVKKQIEKPESTKSTDKDGKEITITKTVKTVEPVNLRIVAPDRKMRGRAELFNAKTVSEYTAMGIMPISLVAKRFGNDGGPLTEKEREFVDELQKKNIDLQREFYELAGAKEEEKIVRRGELAAEIIDVREKIAQIQNSYLGFFENTAEIKARKRLIDWWVVNIVERETEVEEEVAGKKQKVKKFTSLVSGKTPEEKIDKLSDLLDSTDPLEREVAEKASYLVSFWFSSAADLSDREFKGMEEVYDTQITDYTVIDELAPPTPVEEEPVEEPAPSAEPSPSVAAPITPPEIKPSLT